MTRALAAYVHVAGPDGATVAFAPGDVPPPWAASKITNPDAWAGGVPSTAPAPDGDSDPQPPKGNASREEWATYADSLGVQYAEDAKRDDIKAAVEAATTSA